MYRVINTEIKNCKNNTLNNGRRVSQAPHQQSDTVVGRHKGFLSNTPAEQRCLTAELFKLEFHPRGAAKWRGGRFQALKCEKTGRGGKELTKKFGKGAPQKKKKLFAVRVVRGSIGLQKRRISHCAIIVFGALSVPFGFAAQASALDFG